MTRREFIGAGLVATAATALQGEVTATVPGGAGMVPGGAGMVLGVATAGMDGVRAGAGEAGARDLDAIQKEIDAVTPQDYSAFRDAGPDMPVSERDAVQARLPGLARYDRAFDKVFAEVQATTVAPGARPAVWYVYNMGFVVKTAGRLFSIDLCHRQGPRFAPLLDFALITHNHGDHYTRPFYDAMNGHEGKTVVNNFVDNYGAHYRGKHPGGFTRGPKEFVFGDVKVKATVSDHNAYLIDYTMPFEVTVGDFRLYHTGDSQNIDKLNPAPEPDLWLVHPYCGMKPSLGVRKFAPKLTVIGHLQEFGHARDRWRFTFKEGLARVRDVEEAGGRALMPLWGDRIC